jgi:hypothetical protein
MKRPVGTILTAILAICGSLLLLAMMTFESFLMLHPPKGFAMPDQAKFGLAFGAVLFGGMGAWGIVTSIGLFRLKNWARISQIVFSALLALLSLVSAPVILILPAPPNAPADFANVLKVIAAVYVAFGLLGIAWIVYFTRPKVKAAFSGADIERSGRPLSISIIGWWWMLSGFITLPLAWFRLPIVLMGLPLKGWMAAAFMIVFGMIYVVVGYGLLKLNEPARLSAIGLSIFFMMNGVLMTVLPGSQERFMQQMRSSPFAPSDLSMLPRLPVAIFLFTVPVLAVPLWFLITRKGAFLHPPLDGGTPVPAA